MAPPKVSCTTCHKIPISTLPRISKQAQEFDSQHRDEFPPGAMSFWSTIVYFLPIISLRSLNNVPLNVPSGPVNINTIPSLVPGFCSMFENNLSPCNFFGIIR